MNISRLRLYIVIIDVLNKDPEYARTFPRTIEGKEYILKSDSHLWIMPFPREAVSNPGNGTITQNVEK